MKTRFFVASFVAMLICLYFFCIYVPVHKSYDTFVIYVANIIHRQQRLDAIKQAVTPNLYRLFKIVTLVAGGMLVAVACVAIYYAARLVSWLKAIWSYVRYPFEAMRITWKSIDAISKIILIGALVLLAAQSIWYMLYYPITHDEAYTISNFSMNGPLVAATFYPYPNNHILFSIVSYAFGLLPINYAVAYRLPSLLSMLLCCLALFKLFRHIVKDVIAALAVLIFVSSIPVVLFSFMARGYSFLLLFSTGSLLCLINILTADRKRYWTYFTLFSILGLYTVPSYMYAYGSMVLITFLYWLFNKRIFLFRNFFKSAVICTAVTLLLYLPVIVSSGGWGNFHQLLYLGYEKLGVVTWHDIINFIRKTYDYSYYGKPVVAFLAVIIITLVSILLFSKISKHATTIKVKWLFYISVFGCYIPLLAFFMQRTFIAQRIFLNLVVFVLLLLLLFIRLFVVERKQLLVMALCTVVAVCAYWIYGRKSAILAGYSYEDRSAWAVSATMYKRSHAPVDTCYTFSFFFLPAMQLDYRMKQKELFVYQQFPGSPSTKAFSFNDSYPWIIVDSATHIPMLEASLRQRYDSVLVRNDVVLWKRK